MSPEQITETIRKAYEPIREGKLPADFLISNIVYHFTNGLKDLDPHFDAQQLIDIVYSEGN